MLPSRLLHFLPSKRGGKENSEGLGPNMQHLVAAIAAVIVVVGEPSADPRTPAAADVLDDLAIVAGV